MFLWAPLLHSTISNNGSCIGCFMSFENLVRFKITGNQLGVFRGTVTMVTVKVIKAEVINGLFL